MEPFGQRHAARAMARPAAALDQAVTVEHRMDGAFGWNFDVAIKPAHQQLADFTSTPVRLARLELDDEGLRGIVIDASSSRQKQQEDRAVVRGRRLRVLAVALAVMLIGLGCAMVLGLRRQERSCLAFQRRRRGLRPSARASLKRAS
jgi:hypothetical protein